VKEYKFGFFKEKGGSYCSKKVETSFEWDSVIEGEKEIVDFEEKDLLLDLGS
jgi:hypothetical protein